MDDPQAGSLGAADSNSSRLQLSPYAHVGYNNSGGTNPDSFRHYKPLSFAFLGQIYGKNRKGSSANAATEGADTLNSEDPVHKNAPATNPSANMSVVEVVVEHMDS